MISEFMRCLAAAILLADHALTACEGPDEGEATTVVTVPANENVGLRAVIPGPSNDFVHPLRTFTRRAASWTAFAALLEGLATMALRYGM
jgi:hypothetical protein